MQSLTQWSHSCTHTHLHAQSTPGGSVHWYSPPEVGWEMERLADWQLLDERRYTALYSRRETARRCEDATPPRTYAAVSIKAETLQNPRERRHDPIRFRVYRPCLWGCVGSAFHLMSHPLLWIENEKNDVVFERNMMYALDLYALRRKKMYLLQDVVPLMCAVHGGFSWFVSVLYSQQKFKMSDHYRCMLILELLCPKSTLNQN